MKEITIDFLRNNKVGTQCGTVGNVCFTKEIIDLMEKYVDKIELEDWGGDEIEFDNGIYSIGSAFVTFKKDIHVDVKFLKKFIADYYEDDEEEYDGFEYNLVGEYLSILISEADGSWRFDDFDEGLESYFETE